MIEPCECGAWGVHICPALDERIAEAIQGFFGLSFLKMLEEQKEIDSLERMFKLTLPSPE